MRSIVACLLLLLVLPSPPAQADHHAPWQSYEHVGAAETGRSYGAAVAWHGDTVIAGAPSDDRVHVMRLEDGRWRVVQDLEGPRNSDFGASLAVAGNWLAVGAPYENTEGPGDGAVYVFKHTDHGWKSVKRITPQTDTYGFGFSLDATRDWLAVGAPYTDIDFGATTQPSVHLYRLGSNVESKQVLRLSPLLDQRMFGYDVSLHGSRLLVGAPGWISEDYANPGAAILYRLSGGSWSEEASFDGGTLNDGGYGYAVEMTGDQAIVCDDASINFEDDARSLHVYERGAAGWGEVQSIQDVACDRIDSDGDLLATVGSFHPYVRVYGVEGSRWRAMDVPRTSHPSALDLQGGRLALGYPTYAGSVWIFGRNAAPEAVFEEVEPPHDYDGDGVETVTLDGSKSTDDRGIEGMFWYDGERLLGTGATLTLDLEVGLHEIDLYVQDAHLGTDHVHRHVRVLPPPPPVADFSWVPVGGSSAEPFRFVDESTSEYGHVVSWSWDFDGDGAEDATGPTPRWTFEEPGRHPVTLRVETDVGSNDTVTKRVRVANVAPVADAGMDQIHRTGDTVRVELDGGASHDPDGEVASYEWHLDGRRVSREESFSRTLDHGVHDFDLTVRDGHGGVDRDRVTVLVLPPERNTTHSPARPSAQYSWTPHPGPPARAVAFTDRSSDEDGRVVMWWYDVGDDGSIDATEPDPVLSMGGYGGHNVRLTVVDDAGNEATTLQSVFLKNGAPTAAIEARATDAYVGQKVVLVDNSTDPEGELVDRDWDFGDGTTSSDQAPVHVYEAPGTYTVTLRVADEGGLEATASLDVTVRAVPPNVTIPAVAGAPVVAQAEDSPFANEEPLVDTDGDGTPDAPASDPVGADGEDAASEGLLGTGTVGPSVSELAGSGMFWLWVGLALLVILLVAVEVMRRRRHAARRRERYERRVKAHLARNEDPVEFRSTRR